MRARRSGSARIDRSFPEQGRSSRRRGRGWRTERKRQIAEGRSSPTSSRGRRLRASVPSLHRRPQLLARHHRGPTLEDERDRARRDGPSAAKDPRAEPGGRVPAPSRPRSGRHRARSSWPVRSIADVRRTRSPPRRAHLRFLESPARRPRRTTKLRATIRSTIAAARPAPGATAVAPTWRAPESAEASAAAPSPSGARIQPSARPHDHSER